MKTRTEAGLIYLEYRDPLKGLSQLGAVLNKAPDNRQVLEAFAAYYRECSEFDESFVRLADLYQARCGKLAKEKEVPSEKKASAVPVTE